MTPHPSRLGRFLRALLLAAVLLLAAPAAVVGAADPAQASVFTCGCPASAYTMLDRWDAQNFPQGAAWRQIGTSQWIYGGAVHQNREKQLPASGKYREYDAQVYTKKGQARGAKRIVINITTYAAWYSSNHYADFYRM